MVDQAPTVRWEQLTITPPAVVELTLRIGLVVDAEHAQAQLEVRSATDGTLIAMSSWPHIPFHVFDERMREVGSELTRLLREYTGPFR